MEETTRMLSLLFAGKFVSETRFWLNSPVGESVAIGCLALFPLGMVWVITRHMRREWDIGTQLGRSWKGVQRRVRHLVQQSRFLLLKSKAYLVTALGGYDPVLVNLLIYRAALLSQIASSGKFSGGTKPILEGQVQQVQLAILKLDGDYAERFRCKPGVRTVEIINGQGEGMGLAVVDPKTREVRHGYMLAETSGPQR